MPLAPQLLAALENKEQGDLLAVQQLLRHIAHRRYSRVYVILASQMVDDGDGLKQNILHFCVDVMNMHLEGHNTTIACVTWVSVNR